jgi:hypothetical protein
VETTFIYVGIAFEMAYPAAVIGGIFVDDVRFESVLSWLLCRV